jgi:hypothetical protein
MAPCFGLGGGLGTRKHGYSNGKCFKRATNPNPINSRREPLPRPLLVAFSVSVFRDYYAAIRIYSRVDKLEDR